MKWLQCHSTQTAKKEHQRGRQGYKCKQCGRQFLKSYHHWHYLEEVKLLLDQPHPRLSKLLR